MNSPELQLTADGSHTLFLPDLDEHYHSINGAVQESVHVFIEAGLRFWLTSGANTPGWGIHILELGFGTGLNTWLTLREMKDSEVPVVYTSLEKYPLSKEITDRLNYGDLFPGSLSSGNGEERDIPSSLSYGEGGGRGVFQRLHEAPWGVSTPISPNFTLQKVEADFTTYAFSEPVDLIFFDAFAPDKQPEIWTQALFDSLFAAARPGAVLTTYCAKGTVRRMMHEAGFAVERLPGPIGKRHMLRGRKD